MKRIALVLAAALAACASPAKLTVFHTNDIHGWIAERPAGKLDKENPERPLGGFAVLKEAVDQETGPKLLLDSGDWYQGTPEGGLTLGKAPVALMVVTGYDAAVVGNHEYDFGEQNVKDLASGARFPVLGANVYDEATGQRVAYLKPRILKEVGGVKVGIFGLLTSNMRNLVFAKNIKGLKFRREAEEAAEQVAALKAEGADIIIAVNHVGWADPKKTPFEDDGFLARNVPGIDVILGGHTHTPLEQAQKVGRTWIVQSGHYLQRVGRLKLEVDKRGKKVTKASWELLPLYKDVYGADPEVQAVIDRYKDEVGKQLDVPIGRSAAALSRGHDVESPMGGWMTDCLRSYARTQVAFQNAGGIRSEFPAGTLTLRHVYEVMPFDNSVVVVKMKGKDLLDILENGVSGRQGLLQVSGMTLKYDPAAPIGSRVKEAQVGGKPVDPEGLYTAATSDFMAMGGDNYSAFGRAVETEKQDTLLRDVFAGCVRKAEVRAPALGRLQSLSPAPAHP